MILDPAIAATAPSAAPAGVTIDDVFRRVALRRPNALALVDAPNRETFTDGPPRQLTYAEADRVVAAIAGRLRRMGLPIDSIIGIQLPNTVENLLTILGVIRAGMIAAPLPVLWRRVDAVATLTRLGGKALITPAATSAPSTIAISPCTSRRKYFPFATSAASARICPTAWCRSTICLPSRSSIRCRHASASAQ